MASDLEPFEKRDFIRSGYEVQPALNGGFVVHARRDPMLRTPIVAFSNFTDLTRWLTEAHVALAAPKES